ncbi:MAG: ribulose-phosphate 3-epimerase [Candidatus Micrarchaeota archaeon]
MVEVIPSVLSLENYTKADSLKGLVKRVQIDLMDGKFVETNTLQKFEPKKLEEWKTFKKDFHLMVEKPTDFIADYSSQARSFCFHFECKQDPRKVITEIRKTRRLVGLAINLETKNKDFQDLLELVDFVLVMSVKPGKSGQNFSDSVLSKIRCIKRTFNKEICVDGGINEENAAKCVKAGADSLVIGSWLFQQPIRNTVKLSFIK